MWTKVNFHKWWGATIAIFRTFSCRVKCWSFLVHFGQPASNVGRKIKVFRHLFSLPWPWAVSLRPHLRLLCLSRYYSKRHCPPKSFLCRSRETNYVVVLTTAVPSSLQDTCHDLCRFHGVYVLASRNNVAANQIICWVSTDIWFRKTKDWVSSSLSQIIIIRQRFTI